MPRFEGGGVMAMRMQKLIPCLPPLLEDDTHKADWRQYCEAERLMPGL